MILDTIEDDTRLDATLEALQHLRPPSAGPDSSGDEDVRGYTRRNRIISREKKELVLLAANICHVELQARGKDKFWKLVVDKYQEQGGREIVWSTAKSFFLKETRQRIMEKEEEDTSREIRRGEYFEHLDMLINRIQQVDQEQKDKAGGRKKSITEQQSAKERAKENLRRSYGQKRQAEDIIDMNSSDDDFDFDEEGANTNEPHRAAVSGTVPPAENLTPGRSRTTSRSEPNVPNSSRSRGRNNNPKMQKRDEGLFRTVNRLARAIEGGASELAAAIKEIARAPVASNNSSGTTDQAGLIQKINEAREETAQRFQTFEARQEQRQLEYERRQEERRLKLEETNNQILYMLGQVLAQNGNGKGTV